MMIKWICIIYGTADIVKTYYLLGKHTMHYVKLKLVNLIKINIFSYFSSTDIYQYTLTAMTQFSDWNCWYLFRWICNQNGYLIFSSSKFVKLAWNQMIAWNATVEKHILRCNIFVSGFRPVSLLQHAIVLLWKNVNTRLNPKMKQVRWWFMFIWGLIYNHDTQCIKSFWNDENKFDWLIYFAIYHYRYWKIKWTHVEGALYNATL